MKIQHFREAEEFKKVSKTIFEKFISNPSITIDKDTKTFNFFGKFTICLDADKQNQGTLHSNNFTKDYELKTLLRFRLDDLLECGSDASLFHSLDFHSFFYHQNNDDLDVIADCLNSMADSDVQFLKDTYQSNYLEAFMLRDVAFHVHLDQNKYLLSQNDSQALDSFAYDCLDLEFIKFLLDATNVGFWKSSYNKRSILTMFDYLSLLPLRDNLYRLKETQPQSLAFAILVLLNHVDVFNCAFDNIKSYDDFMLGEYLVGNAVITFPSGMIDNKRFVQITNAKSWSWMLKQQKSTINKLVSLYLPSKKDRAYYGFCRFRETVAVLASNNYDLTTADLNKLLDLCVGESISVDRLFADVSSFSLNDEELYDVISKNDFSEIVLKDYIEKVVQLDNWNSLTQDALSDLIGNDYAKYKLKSNLAKLARQQILKAA